MRPMEKFAFKSPQRFHRKIKSYNLFICYSNDFLQCKSSNGQLFVGLNLCGFASDDKVDYPSYKQGNDHKFTSLAVHNDSISYIYGTKFKGWHKGCCDSCEQVADVDPDMKTIMKSLVIPGGYPGIPKTPM